MRGTAVTLATCLSLTVLGACSSGETGSASCAAIVDAGGVRYLGWGGELDREPDLTGRTLQGRVPSCDDGNGESESYDLEVAEIRGVPMTVAVHSDHGLYVAEGEQVPEELRRLSGE
jgi:hypothetical protein